MMLVLEPNCTLVVYSGVVKVMVIIFETIITLTSLKSESKCNHGVKIYLATLHTKTSSKRFNYHPTAVVS